jgi:hypothetical protein
MRITVQKERIPWAMAAGRTLLGPALIVLAALVCAVAGRAQTAKVGTFDKASVVVAFYNSPYWSAKINAALAEREKAQAVGDEKKVAELSKWGQDQQELAHRQLAGEAPIDNIMEMLRPALPGIAAKAHVAMIVSEVPWADSSVTIVDVTDLLLDELQASAKTRRTVEQMRQSPGESKLP